MKEQSVETLDTDIPNETKEVEIEHEFRDFVRSTSFDNCPMEDVEICSASRSFKGSSEDITALPENLTWRKRKDKCNKDVVCTLFKISESPTTEKRNSSRVSEF